MIRALLQLFVWNLARRLEERRDRSEIVGETTLVDRARVRWDRLPVSKR